MIKNESATQPRYIYIMLSRTGTALGKAIRLGTRCEYNHCSMGFDDDVTKFYSFGRKSLYNVFYAGFVEESKDFGFFKVHPNSKICILRLAVSQYQFNRAKACISDFARSNSSYTFNIFGIATGYVGIPFGDDSMYFCSQFVAETLTLSGIADFKKDSRLTKPEDMLTIPDYTIIYRGPIKDYAIEAPAIPIVVIA